VFGKASANCLASVMGAVWCLLLGLVSWQFLLIVGILQQVFVGEFDPGSGRTLAACLTHASRAERPFGVLERRTGE
jgi:hypothetical protein